MSPIDTTILLDRKTWSRLSVHLRRTNPLHDRNVISDVSICRNQLESLLEAPEIYQQKACLELRLALAFIVQKLLNADKLPEDEAAYVILKNFERQHDWLDETVRGQVKRFAELMGSIDPRVIVQQLIEQERKRQALI